MMHRSTMGSRSAKRVVMSLLASACLIAGSPVVGVSSASTGAHKAVTANFGDCKNDNRGNHNGYDCPSDAPTPPPVVTTTDPGTPPPVVNTVDAGTVLSF
jgi:hypothetical protein